MKIYLLIGLGNPGEQYKNTRHNFGFLTINELADFMSKKLNQKLDFINSKKFKSEICEFNLTNNKKVILAKPQTLINLSGITVSLLKKFYKTKEIIIIHDDLNLSLGTIRLKFGGQSGGHLGIKNIIKNIGSDFWRLKLGIGPQPKNTKAEDFVLQNFKEKDKVFVKKITKLSVKQILFPNLQSPHLIKPITINLKNNLDV